MRQDISSEPVSRTPPSLKTVYLSEFCDSYLFRGTASSDGSTWKLKKAFDTSHLYFFNDDAKSVSGLSKTKPIDHLFDQERKDGAVALFFDAFLQEASLNLFF